MQFKLQQVGPNRDGIGSWVEVRHGSVVMRQEITIGGGHASGRLGWIHFGLGEQTHTEVRVIWPDGLEGEWQKIDVNQFFVLERYKPVKLWMPK